MGKSSRPKGRLLFAHVETPDAAANAAEAYREDRRNKGTWTVRTYPRWVRADGQAIPCTAVVVREKVIKLPQTEEPHE